MKTEQTVPGFPVYLPEEGDPVRFVLGEDASIEVRQFDGRLQVRAVQGALRIRPTMSNQIEIWSDLELPD